MWRKLLKGLAWLVVLLAAAVFLFVWQYLGVMPFEGDVESLFELVSTDVEFYVRCPGTGILEEPVVQGLGEEEGFEALPRWRDEMLRAFRDVARDVNPQIPLGLVDVDLGHDLRGKDMALAGTVDVPSLRLNNFLVAVRIPGYAKFVSALMRDAVRSRLPFGNRISVVAGSYFKLKDAKLAEALAPLRTQIARPEPDAFWFGRIRDVVVLTDEPSWVVAAISGPPATLPADVEFKTEFAELRRADVEMFVRPNLAQKLLVHYARPEHGELLHVVSRVVPPQVMGNVTVQARPAEDGVALGLVDTPMAEGYARIGKPFLVKLYEREKADLRFDFTENGIARLLPRRGVVAAVTIHADADTVAALFCDVLSEADRSNLDSVARESGGAGGRGYRSFEELLVELGKDLADTHMLIVHRPSAFEKADYSMAEDPQGLVQPWPQASFTLVSKVRDTVAPEKVVEKFTANLRWLGLGPAKDEGRNPLPLQHPSGKFYVADPLVNPRDLHLFHAAYGAVNEGGRYFVFTSSVENMEAVLRAAQDAEARLIAEPAVAAAIERLPAEGTLALVARGGALRDLLADRVRPAFADAYPIMDLMKGWRAEEQQRGITDDAELDRRMQARAERFRADRYPGFREEYLARVSRVASLDTSAIGVSLGVGSAKQVRGEGYVLFRGAVAPPGQ